ncbi:MAG: DUF1631 family protein [Alcanivoracaceae bacterium]|nr:DUF1631 family protein [Alcanivoracaceae bacterium]
MINRPQKNDKNDKNNSTETLFQISHEFEICIKLRLDAFFDSLKAILFVFEQNAKTDYKQSLNYVVIKSIIDKQPDIGNKFFASINLAFKYFEQEDYDFFINENTYINNHQSSNNKDHGHDEVAVIMMLINKSKDANEKYLPILTGLFSEIAVDKTLTFNQIPISPFVVMNSLVNGIKNIDLSSDIRMIVYNTFDINVLLKLNSIYTRIIKKTGHKAIDIDHLNEDPEQNGILDSTYEVIAQLFHRHSELKGSNRSIQSYIRKDLLVQTLNVIQKQIIKKNQQDESYAPSFKEIKRLLSLGVVRLNKKVAKMRLSQSDSDTIDLLTLFFKYIANDNSIPHILKKLLLRLQIPILKIALQDKGMFKNKTHPIRLLLNQVSYVPDGFSDELNSSNKYVIKLEEIIAVILLQSAYDSTLYENLLNELNQFIDKMKKRFKLIQKRIKEKAIGLEKITQVKYRVLEILDEKMHDKYMPIFIRDLLLNTWNNVLILEHLRHPEESQACQSKVAFIDMLLNCSRSVQDNYIGINDIKKISIQFIEGLDLVAYNSKDLSDKNNELVSFLVKLHGLEGQMHEIENVTFEKQHHQVVLYFKNEKSDQLRVIQKDRKTDYFDKKASTLKVGTWLEFTKKTGKLFRAKISWISPITGRYLLVNSNGVRLADKSVSELAEAFRDKTCSELETVPLFDRILLEIAKEMKHSI